MDVRAVQPVVRARAEVVRLRHQPDLVHAGAREGRHLQPSYYDVNQAIVVLKGTKIANVHRSPACATFKLGAQLGTTSYDYIKDTIKPSSSLLSSTQNAAAIQALKNKQIDGLVVDLPTAFYITAVQVAELDDPRPVPGARRGRALRHGVREGQPARGLRRPRARRR